MSDRPHRILERWIDKYVILVSFWYFELDDLVAEAATTAKGEEDPEDNHDGMHTADVERKL